MADIEIIKQQIEDLESLACEVEELGTKLLNDAPMMRGVPIDDPYDPGHSLFKWGTLPPEAKSIQRESIRKYQRYVIAGSHFIKEFIPEKEAEFSAHYTQQAADYNYGIMDFLLLRTEQLSSERSILVDRFRERLEIQRSILCSIPDLVKIKELQLREIISADFVDREIEEAEFLFRNKNYRAAGALAGVALEKHLQTLCDKYEIEYKKTDTIGPLSQKLYDHKKMEKSQMRLVQYLGDIRNKCDHPDDLVISEIESLVEGVKKFV